MHNGFLIKEINEKKSWKIFFGILFSVQKGNHNYDLQKSSKDRPANSISEGNMAGNKRRKKSIKKTNSSKKTERILINIIQAQFVP